MKSLVVPLGRDFVWFELNKGARGSLTGLWGAETTSWMSGEQPPLTEPLEPSVTSSMLTAASSLRPVRAWLRPREAGAELLCGVTGLSTVGPGAGLRRPALSFMAGL